MLTVLDADEPDDDGPDAFACQTRQCLPRQPFPYGHWTEITTNREIITSLTFRLVLDWHHTRGQSLSLKFFQVTQRLQQSEINHEKEGSNVAYMENRKDEGKLLEIRKFSQSTDRIENTPSQPFRNQYLLNLSGPLVISIEDLIDAVVRWLLRRSLPLALTPGREMERSPLLHTLVHLFLFGVLVFFFFCYVSVLFPSPHLSSVRLSWPIESHHQK